MKKSRSRRTSPLRARAPRSLNSHKKRERTLETLEARMPLAADVMISEVMYHPGSNQDAHEYVELFNRGTTAANLTGWQLDGGVDYTFGARILNPGQYVVVVKNGASFSAAYPAVSNFVAGYVGDLHDDGEQIELKDATGALVDQVAYADQGDWASRVRGPIVGGQQGWMWTAQHDGGGRSLELVNPALPNNAGQNWGASSAVAGTPGATNSLNDSDAAPLISGVQHTPAVPRSTDAVTILARLSDEQATGLVATLHHRLDGQATFASALMYDDGYHGDGAAGDGLYGTVLPPRADGSVVEFYVSARDAASNLRTWPAPAGPTNQQLTNALYLVEDSATDTLWVPGSAPIYRLIVTAAERAVLDQVAVQAPTQATSAVKANGAFISVDGTGAQIRYNVGVNIHTWDQPLTAPPHDYQLEIPRDQPWKDQSVVTLKHDPWQLQALASAVFQLAGVTSGYGTAIQFSINGESNQPYSVMETPSREFVARHFPGDSSGNLYTTYDNAGQPADLRYEGPTADAYRDSYLKRTNQSQDNWSDLVNLTNVLNNASDATYVDQVTGVIDVDQWLRMLAVDSLVGQDTGLTAGVGGNYSLYRRPSDSRFVLLPRDLSASLGNVPGSIGRSIFALSDVPALERLVTHPQFVQRYYQSLVDAMDEVFNPAVMNPLVDQFMANADPSLRDQIKQYVEARAQQVLSQIPTSFTVTSNLPQQAGFHRTTAPLAVLSGTASAVTTGSVLVGGVLADWSPMQGTWSISGGSENQLALNPGINRVLVEAMSGPIGTGDVLQQSFLDIWYDNGMPELATPFVLPFGSVWNYYDQGDGIEGHNLGTAWRNLSNPGWPAGPAEFGYGNNDEETETSFGPDADSKYITTYFLRNFTIEPGNAAQYDQLTIELLKDDGASIYINGVEVVRSNLPGVLGDSTINYLTFANTSVDNLRTTHTLTPQQLAGLLHDGDNLIAVEMHQQRRTSGDMSFDLRMTISQSSADPRNVSGTLGPGETVWTAEDGPYFVVGDVTVPATGTLTIEPGTTVYFSQGRKLTVNGVLNAVGTKYQRIRMTGVPGAALVPDIRPELPLGPPKWMGVQIIDSPSVDNLISYVDIEYAQNLEGSILVRDSEAIIDHISFSGTRLRMILSDTSSLIIRDSVFPDMFRPEDSPLEMTPPMDNASEHIEENGGIPLGGHMIIERNLFGRNKGHNDTIDLDSNLLPGALLQIRDNVFLGGGDEAYDGGGDFLMEGNTFYNYVKDYDNDGTGDSNGATTGDGDTSIAVLVRNKYYNFDHAVNFKNASYGYVENNTFVSNSAPHWSLPSDTPIRMLDFSVINMLIPNIANPQTGTPRDPAGKGVYTAGNIYVDIPQTVFGHPDMNPTHGGIVSNLEVHDSLVPSSSVFANSDGLHGRDFDYLVGDARLVNPAGGDFRLRPGSPAIGTGPNGIDMGAEVARGASISGEPPAITGSSSATLTVGGPGIFSFIYRVNGGEWSEEVIIGSPTDIDSPAKTRTAQIELTGLSNGSYTVEVSGRDVAGVLQPVPAVSKTWTVDDELSRILISEVLVSNTQLEAFGMHPDMIELYNAGVSEVNLSGYKLSESPTSGSWFTFPVGTFLEPGERLVVYADGAFTAGLHTPFTLESGEGVYLYSGANLVDSIQFGLQIDDFSIARTGHFAEWTLAVPTLGSANVAARTGDPSLLKINEWFADGDVRLVDDFVELYNGDTLPVDLSEMHLSDTPVTQPGQHEIAPLSFIAGNGFQSFLADRNTAPGPDHLPFELSGDDGHLALLDAQLNRIDQIVYTSQTTDYSQGRSSDGSAGLAFFALPTRGMSNALADNAGAQAILNQLRITEIMHSPAGGNANLEYIELQNVGPAPLNLAGVRLASGVEFSFPAMTLAAGARTVVVKNIASFTAAYGNGRNVAGFWIGELDTSEEIVLRLPPPYEAAALRFEYDGQWYPQTIAQGRALVIVDATVPAADWDEKGSWRAGTPTGGTPGLAEPVVAPTFDVIDVSPDPRAASVQEITLVFSEPVTGFQLADLTLRRGAGSNLLTGGQTLVTTDNIIWHVQNLSPLTTTAGTYELRLNAAGSGIQSIVGGALATNGFDQWVNQAAVAGRHIFYNQSFYDGGSAAANANDDGAIAPDKQPLLAGGTAAFANYTNYLFGINGLMIDISGLAGTPTAGDFTFRTGNDNTPSGWETLQTAPAISVRPGAGIGGSDRVTLIWPNFAIFGKWLQVTVNPSANTGVATPDTFHWGNAIGEAMHSPISFQVTAIDEIFARNNPRSNVNPAPIDFPWDYNRDRRVTATDQIIARNNRTTILTMLKRITVPAVLQASELQDDSSSSIPMDGDAAHVVAFAGGGTGNDVTLSRVDGDKVTEAALQKGVSPSMAARDLIFASELDDGHIARRAVGKRLAVDEIVDSDLL